MGRVSKTLAVAFAPLLAFGALVASASPVSANPISGAIFTTLANAVAAGLPDDTYVFQVTDPSGHTLLSTDVGGCRQVTVIGGVFSNVTPSGACGHVLGTSPDGGISVQLMPYDDTPNNGGEYKA